ncbi:MAG TPA: DNRLRE domain-containing protein, partial [Thermoanaerobaculia bacterium]|nr:DNRLRE domain-containing protein [Thermoanaerobaculia bacterium]
MQRCRGLAIVGCLLLGLAAQSQAQTFTLQAAADTYLQAGNANQNHGGDAVLQVAGNQRALLRFDPAAVASAVGSGRLVSASLELFVHSASGWGADGRPVEAHSVTADWTEAGATWNCAVDANPGNSKPDCAAQWAGGSFALDPTDTLLQANDERRFVQFDVTADVAAFLSGSPNQGWLLQRTDDEGGGKVEYSSREAAAAERPRLVLLVETAANDQVAPSLAITAPAQPILVNEPAPVVTLEYADGGSGVDTATLQVLVDGHDATASCTALAQSASCRAPSLAAGNHTVEVHLR